MAVAAAFLPFVYVAKHDSDAHVQELFETTWNEHVAGARTVLLYLGEIVGLAIQHLDSARWVLKHTAALSVADAAKSAGDEMNLGQQQILWPALERATSGKTWEGKADVLDAFVGFARRSKQLQQERSEMKEQMKKVSDIPSTVASPHYPLVLETLAVLERVCAREKICSCAKSVRGSLRSFGSLD